MVLAADVDGVVDVLDDVGGLAIAVLALVFARALTGPISRVRA